MYIVEPRSMSAMHRMPSSGSGLCHTTALVRYHLGRHMAVVSCCALGVEDANPSRQGMKDSQL